MLNPYQRYIALSRYARFLPEKKRRETWSETVSRYCGYFASKNELFPKDRMYDAITNLHVMPSMRALMTAGKALDRDNIAGYNCSYLAVDDPRAFDEALFILMCGTGLGFSVERQFVSKMPEIAENFYQTETVIKVRDSKLGWASSFRELISLLYGGHIPQWDLAALRPAGAPLKTFGGRSSGPAPLNDLFRYTVSTFVKAAGRKLNSLECHDLMCKIADVVVVGGVRRCLPSNAPVSTPSGPKAIGELVRGDKIVTGGKIGTVIASESSGKKQTIIIKHRFGQLECTPEHRVAVFNSIMKYEFKPASEIIEGDRLVWDSVGYEGEITSLPSLTEKLHFNANEFFIPNLTPDVAWLLGLFQGDGCVTDKVLEISGNIAEMNFLARAETIFKKDFGIGGEYGKDGRAGVGARLRVNSSGLSRWFFQHIKQPNVCIRVPTFIMNGTRDIRFAYLSGLFDADGRNRPDGRIDQVSTVYREFVDDLVMLLAGLGIGTYVGFGNAKRRRAAGVNAQDFWTVSIIGNVNRKTFCDGCSKQSLKLSRYKMRFNNSIDFSFPIRWTGGNQGYKPNGNINVTAMRYDLPLLPTRVISINKGRQIDTHDIEVEGLSCFTTNGIVVHNSALISLSNLSDYRLRGAKAGQWWTDEPQRALSNNSVAYTEKPGMLQFMQEWTSLYESKSGERGIVNRVAAKKKVKSLGDRRKSDFDFGVNPCGEISLRPQEFCNLTEVIIRENDTLQTLLDKVEIATILGTFQSTLTDFRYLRSIWKKNVEEERLLGVSLTGIMDHPILSHVNDEAKIWLAEMRKHAIEVNKEWAAKLGINPSAAITTVKPSGCTTLDTKIKTNFGDMTMAEIFALNDVDPSTEKNGSWHEVKLPIKVYDENNEEQDVTKLYINGVKEVFEIEFEDGLKFRFTGNHHLKTNNGWKRVDELTDDDEIISFT